MCTFSFRWEQQVFERLSRIFAVENVWFSFFCKSRMITKETKHIKKCASMRS